MTLYEITLEEALKQTVKGNEVFILAAEEGRAGIIMPLVEVLSGARYFVAVGETPVVNKPEPEEMPGENPQPSATAEKPKKKKGRTPSSEIDVGKIKALHAAGWSQPKIADEMQLSQATISRVINGRPKKEDKT